MTTDFNDRLREAYVGLDPRPGDMTPKKRCPGHEDADPSLAGKEQPDGTFTVFDHGGCDNKSILDALVGPKADVPYTNGASGPPRPAATASAPSTYSRKRDHIVYEVGGYWHVRVPGKQKRFFWVDPKTMLLGLPVSVQSLPLYRAEDVEAFDKAKHVFVNEGEKATDACRAAGLQAVGTATGSSSSPDDLTALRGFKVILVPDNDPAGVKHMGVVGTALKKVAASVAEYQHKDDAPKRADMADLVWPGLDAGKLNAMAISPGPTEGVIQRLQEVKERLRPFEAPEPVTSGTADTPGPLPEPGTSGTSVTSGTASAALAGYLDDVAAFLRRYVVWPSDHAVTAVALWVAHSHLIEQCEVSPILALTSPEMRSGKTRVLDCLEVLCATPERMVTPSAAVAYTLMSQRPRPTFLLDEGDALFGNRKSAERHEDLRAVLNAGNRAGTTVPRVRMDGAKREVERLDVFGAKAIAGIGDLPDTITDRSIVIHMRRKAPGERVAGFRRRQAQAAAQAIAAPDWTAIRLAVEVPGMPESMNDRAQDGWEPLLAIADEAGGLWPAKSRRAAMSLAEADEVKVTVGVRLLTDIRECMAERTHLPTAALLLKLHDLDESPWAEWYGSPMAARGLAKLLEPYDIRPVQRRVGGEVVRAYWRTDFEDAWSRYVPPSEPVHVPDVPAVPLVPVPQGSREAADGRPAEATA